jgi:hypothetical protein
MNPKLAVHPSHKLRFSESMTYDYVCQACGRTDQVPGGWGDLKKPCRGKEKRREMRHMWAADVQ